MSGRGGATCLPLSGRGSGLGGEGQLLTGSQHPGDGGPDVEVQRLEQQVDSHPCVSDDRGATVGDLMVLDPRSDPKSICPGRDRTARLLPVARTNPC